jgi:6-pyruvoyltetrahydropterin/6-carboxytetrahydropterin synthase
MLETFVEFTFEAAHQIPPHSGLHGHSFRVVVYLTGKPDPTFGWTHNLYEVEATLATTKELLDHSYLNDIEGLELPTLENIARWIWRQLDKELSGLDRVVVRRGLDGAGEGCSYSGRQPEDTI